MGMMSFIQEGGFPSLLILLFAVVALIAAGSFAWRPAESKLPTLHAINRVILCTIALGTLTGLRDLARAVGDAPDKMGELLVAGTGEAITIGILGFGVLSAVYILIAVGHRRLRG